MGKRAGQARSAARQRSERSTRTNPWREPARWLLLLAATAVAYWPALNGGLLWDDVAHLTRPELQSLNGLSRIWFDIGATQQYYPVVHSTFWLLDRLWGHELIAYHVFNVGLHATNAWLIARIMVRLGIPGALLASLLFALHPVHVESVAWITELKNTLSGLLVLLSTLAYLRFELSRHVAPYITALVLFVLAVLSKTVTATLPAALLVIIWWRRGQLARRDLLPLAPFFVLGIAAGLLTIWVERTLIGAQGTEFTQTFIERIIIAGRASWFYLWTLIWPVNLSFNYERWQIAFSWWQLLFAVGVVGLLAALWLQRYRARSWLAALVIFLITIFPALGFFNVYPFRYSFVADHFQYLASVSILIAIAASAARFFEARRLSMAPLLGIVAVVLGVLTWNQSSFYRDAETLWRHTLEQNPQSRLAHNNLGIILMDVPGRADQAAAHFRQTLRLTPSGADPLLQLERAHIQCNLALASARDGKIDESRAARADCVHQAPPGFDGRRILAEVGRQLAANLSSQKRLAEAIEELKQAVTLAPEADQLQLELAAAFRNVGATDDAISALRVLLPRVGRAQRASLRNDIGILLATAGRLDEARREFEEALKLEPGFGAARSNLDRLKGREQR